VVEESLYFDKQKAAYGGPGLAALSKTWYVASANLQDGFSSRLAVMNPGIAPANVTLTLVTGQTKPVTDSLSIPVAARGRTDIALNEFSGDPQAAVILQSDQPVAMQTVTYYSSGGENDPIAVYSALASASPARQWYLPETTSNDDFDSYVMIFNPGSLANQVAVSYLIDSGETVSKTYDLPGLGQAVLRVLDEVKGKKAAAAAVRGSQPLIAERVIMFRRSVGAAASAGIPAP
jgi:hypothetical protein